MIEVILVPTDGSSHATEAIELAGDIANRYGARLVLLHVLLRNTSESEIETLCGEKGLPDALKRKLEDFRQARIDLATSGYEGVVASVPMPDDVLKDVADVILENAKSTAESMGASDIKTQIVDGSAAESIIAAAKHEKADMIVMGSRGLGDMKSLMLGSVSHKVLQQSKCPCLVTK